MNNHETENTIDLLALLRYLQKKIWILLAVTVVFAILGFLYSLLFVTPLYTASTRIYVLNRSNEDTVVSSDFQISSYMVNDYRELIKGRNVTQEVINQLDLNMSAGSLSQNIYVESPQNTRILQISVVDTNPGRAQQIANTVREVASAQLTEIMKVDSVTTIYEANVPSGPSNLNTKRNVTIAGLIGLVLSIAIYVLIFVVDDRIRTEDDVTRYLGLSIMGVIPDNANLSEKGIPERKRIPGKRKGRGNKTWK